MTTLAEQQRWIRDLIKGRAQTVPADTYLAEVAASPGLAMIQEIALWWRAFQLENHCVWTSKLLKRLGLFHECVEEFFSEIPVSPYVEKAGEQFLIFLRRHENPLVSSIAQTERAMLQVKNGHGQHHTIDWDRNPEEFFRVLRTGEPLPAADAEFSYQLHLSVNSLEVVRNRRSNRKPLPFRLKTHPA